jgi:hypothetical protein
MQSTRDSVASKRDLKESKRDLRGWKLDLTTPRAGGRVSLPRLQAFEIRFISEQESSTFRPFAFTVVEDDRENVTIEVSEENYRADLAAGIDEEATLKRDAIRSSAAGFSRVIRS